MATVTLQRRFEDGSVASSGSVAGSADSANGSVTMMQMSVFSWVSGWHVGDIPVPHARALCEHAGHATEQLLARGDACAPLFPG